MSADYAEILRLYRKYSTHKGQPLHEVFTQVGRALEVAEAPERRADLAIMLTAWRFWGELGEDLQQELLDCIEYTYASTIARPRSIAMNKLPRDLIDREPDHGQYAKPR